MTPADKGDVVGRDIVTTPTEKEISHPQVTEGNLRMKSQELGLFGKFFGSREHAPVNIAGALILLGLAGMMLAPFLPTSNGFNVGDMEKALGALILAALSFLGGYLGGGGGTK
ncbi:hypothetical protein P9272_13725 [Mesorhizobium sp. WSM4976]|uniref:hypothetical protein n=1 Tax=Mesorhizobium sp. WSM4976 TaxID=3038549 RepID=UPI002416C357|nr:hypothetical protein [Mesorhizobium sp. WSM4976]MDG4894632.1 hypothetical protein [Mesorhizobium sp. WSM4976]